MLRRGCRAQSTLTTPTPPPLSPNKTNRYPLLRPPKANKHQAETKSFIQQALERGYFRYTPPQSKTTIHYYMEDTPIRSLPGSASSSKFRKVGYPGNESQHLLAEEHLNLAGNESPSSPASVSTSIDTSTVRSSNSAGASQSKPPERIYDLWSWRHKSPNARVIYIKDMQHADMEVSRIQQGPMGFDLEWKPTYLKGARENPVALVQLATADTILLIQISAMPMFPEKLRELLFNPVIVKAGVSIQNDCKKLWADWGVSVRNCVDLSLLARTVDNSRWKGRYVAPIGLARLCETYFELTLAKGKTQRSNWEAHLTLTQQEYAANDAHTGLWVYEKLSFMSQSVSPAPQPHFYSFDLIGGYLYHPTADETRMHWRPHNPHYDTGPMPEKKPKDKEKKPRLPGQQGESNHLDGEHTPLNPSDQSRNTEAVVIRSFNRGGEPSFFRTFTSPAVDPSLRSGIHLHTGPQPGLPESVPRNRDGHDHHHQYDGRPYTSQYRSQLPPNRGRGRGNGRGRGQGRGRGRGQGERPIDGPQILA